MRIAILHYHLIRGGVSSVVRQQARSLVEAGEEVLVLAGETGADSSRAEYGGAPLAVVPDLRYDARRIDASSASAASAADRRTAVDRLASAILDAMQRHWGSCADVVHVHNPLIRKNSLLIGALRELRRRGARLLLQNHDFAEDFRPDVYLSDEGYPEDCHYAAINGRDHSFLKRAGLNPEGTHLLPNAVTPLEAAPGLPRTRYLYPVRAIRRKNLGEALLLSMFIPKGRTVAITLPPVSARDEASYRHWKAFAARLRLPVEFAVGDAVPLSYLMGSSVCAISTSVKEGFGFSFLEPWTARRSVVGRRLGYVCADFEKAGVRFPDSYDSVDVPLVYLPAPQLRKKLETALMDAYTSFGLEAPNYALKSMTDDVFSRDYFDFGRLDEELQTEVLETVASNAAAREDIAQVNPFLASLGSWEPDEALVESNRETVLTHYSGERAWERLMATYRAVIEKPVSHRLSKAILLELFLDPLRLSLVGVGRA